MLLSTPVSKNKQTNKQPMSSTAVEQQQQTVENVSIVDETYSTQEDIVPVVLKVICLRLSVTYVTFTRFAKMFYFSTCRTSNKSNNEQSAL